ncbi:MAG: serine/threonine-protein kinase [Planctomycetota bacterium]|jgi:serine/threonine protein kinase
MSSQPPEPDPSPEEERLAGLLVAYESLREEDPDTGVGQLRDEAGELFPELKDLAECLGIVKTSMGEAEDRIPTEIGRYRVRKKIGIGVSGTVYEAEDSDSGRPVAIKVLRESLALSNVAVERFRREYASTGKLDDPHIVRVLDHGEWNGRLFFVMEFVDGGSLEELLEEIETDCGPEPGEDWLEALDRHGVPGAGGKNLAPAEAYARRVCALLAPVAHALARAAEAGLIHRDVKPANIMLRGDGRAQVADFGLAKLVGEEITSTVAVLGTPAYMSPEQAGGRSRDVDARTDVYGLAATLHKAVTLDHPIAAESFGEFLAAIRSQPPKSIREFCPGYPRDLARVVARCLEKSPDDRYPDARSLGDDLARVSAGKRPRLGALPPHRRARRFIVQHRAVAASALSLLVLLVLVVYLFVEPAPPARLSVAASPDGLVALDGEVKGPSPWSGEVPSGEHVVRVTRDRYLPAEVRLELAPGEPRPVHVDLVPEDASDRELLMEVIRAHGMDIELPPDFVPRPRGVPGGGGDWTEAVVVAAPRGDVGASDLAIHLYRAERLEGLAVELLEGEEVLHRADVPPGQGLAVLPAALLRTGGSYRIRVKSDRDEGSVETEFRVVTAEPLPAWMTASTEPAARVLAAAALLDAGRHAEAFAAAMALGEEHPDVSLAWRIALGAMERMHLMSTRLYLELFDRYEKARERER